MNTVWMTVAAYLLGSISFAVITSKLFGIADPRTYGSKNPGATNVLRSGNKAAAIVTLIGDATIALVAIAVFLGHLWPVFFRFVGGKGVATALGVLLGLNPWLGLATFVTWLAVAFAFRYSSLAALIAALFAPFYYGLLFGFDPQLAAVFIMCVLLIFRHRNNISNLIAGKESRIGSKSKDAVKAKK